MSSIAYITDGKLLENHRLHQNKTMNFWRLSTNLNFSDFNVGDLVFFLSKSREHLSQSKEKGIIGFGRLENVYNDTPSGMWTRFFTKNGYNTFEEFEDAIKKVHKDKVIPKQISSLYLENVCFFQSPIYLSEFDMNISKNVESYIYLKDEEILLKILEFGKINRDLWSSDDEYIKRIAEEEVAVMLSLAHKSVGDVKINPKKIKDVEREVKSYLRDNPIYRKINGSVCNMYYVYEDNLTILLYKDEDITLKELVGEAILYKKYIKEIANRNINVYVKTIDNDNNFNEVLSEL